MPRFTALLPPVSPPAKSFLRQLLGVGVGAACDGLSLNEERFEKKSEWPKALPGDDEALGRGGFNFTYLNNMNSPHPLSLENTDTLKNHISTQS